MTGHSRFAVSVHILAYLAYRQRAAVPSGEIAASVDTHPVVIRRLLSALVKARIVTAQKGATGGFALALPPARISLRDIYRAVEPHPARGLAPFAPNPRCPVGAHIHAILESTLLQLQASMEAGLAHVTLARIREQLRPVCPATQKI